MISITLYILFGIGLKTIADKRGLSRISWMAFLPLINAFLVARVAETIPECKYKGFHVLALIFSIATAVLWLPAMIPYVGFVFAPIFFIVCAGTAVVSLICYYKTFKQIIPDSATGIFILSVLVPPAASVVYFVIRNRETAGENIDIVQ